MKAKPFHFKQFVIEQDRCALKVGTDGVLLGAWTECRYAKSILDIGSGTGVLSLMIAQRSAGKIKAVEIEKNAGEQCSENFKRSTWSEKLECTNTSLQNYAGTNKLQKFDLIISNPPFYSIQEKNTSRNIARSEQELTLKELLNSVSKLLTINGSFSMIFPNVRKLELLETAAGFQLFPCRICSIKGNENSEVKRILIEFRFSKQEIEESQLTIEKERHNYTEDYKILLKEYLTIF